jgi:hypothetical protein
LIFRGYILPEEYNKNITELLVKLPMSYPKGRPDMFWTDVDLAIMGKSMPDKAKVVETIIGKQWRRFSVFVTKLVGKLCEVKKIKVYPIRLD